jgi:pimeloyl-ACP methyl ester carboxylesterase
VVELLDTKLEHLGELPDGRRFERESTGAGEPLLWIEGGPGLPAHLGRPEAAMLGSLFTAHLVNAPGCGRTSPPSRPDDYDLAGHVTFFDDVRSALEIDRWTLVGHSWGGLVAMAYAAMKPARVRRLIVIDGYAGGGSVSEADAAAERERSFARVRDRGWFAHAIGALEASDALEAPTEREDVTTFAPAWALYFSDPDLPGSRAHLERLVREMRQNVDVQRIWNDRHEAADHRDLAAAVTCPTLIVVGEHDFICGPVWNHVLANAIPGARYVEILDAGHFPQYEQPDEVMRIVSSWLAEERLRIN